MHNVECIQRQYNMITRSQYFELVMHNVACIQWQYHMLTRSQLHRTSNITYISRVSEVGKNDRLTKLQQNIIHARLERLYLKDLHRGNQRHHYDKLKNFENLREKWIRKIKIVFIIFVQIYKNLLHENGIKNPSFCSYRHEYIIHWISKNPTLKAQNSKEQAP